MQPDSAKGTGLQILLLWTGHLHWQVEQHSHNKNNNNGFKNKKLI